jgi:hypothetical protein
MIQIWRNLATKPEGTSVILQATLYPAESLKASARHWSKANLGKISIRTLKDGRLLCTLVKKPGSVKPAPSFDGIVTLEAGESIVYAVGPGQTRKAILQAVRREGQRAKSFTVVRVINGLQVTRTK